MPDDEGPKIIADDDWKAEAQREKERLAAEAEKDKAEQGAADGEKSLFLDLLEILAQQAMIALGGAQLPDGRTIPGNPAAAKHFVDMIGELEVKTKGNLTKEESEILASLLSRMRWAFTMAAKQSVGDAAPPEGEAPPSPPPGEPPPG